MATSTKSGGERKKRRSPADAAPEELIALSFASGASYEEICRRHDISQSTAYRLSLSPDFQATVLRMREELVAAGGAKLIAAFAEAVNKLVQLMRNGDSDRIQLMAAKTVVESMLRVREHVTLMRRMDEIERRLGITPAEAARAAGRPGGSEGESGAEGDGETL